MIMTANEELFSVLETGDQAKLQALITASPSLAAARNESGTSALLYTFYMGKQALVPVLLAAKQWLDIFEAAALGLADTLAELLSADSLLARAFTADGFMALHYSAFFGREIEGAKLLL